MTEHRRVVINGDDFGRSAGINEGIIRAYDRAVLSSASLMVRWPSARAAAALAATRPSLAVGLHFDLGEWAYTGGEWVALYERVGRDDERGIATEADAQVERFKELTGHNPTHIDSHQHVHRDEPVRAALLGIARRLDIPLRDCTPGIGYCGAFYGQTMTGEPWPRAITVESLIAILSSLPAGTTEVACHPASRVDMDGMYRHERPEELRTLCDPRVRNALADHAVELTSFADVGACWRTAQEQL